MWICLFLAKRMFKLCDKGTVFGANSKINHIFFAF